MEKIPKASKIVIFDWGGVIENNDPNEYTISKVIIEIMRKYNCKLTDDEILKICSNGSKLHKTFIDNREKITKEWFKNIKNKLNINCEYEEYKKDYYEFGKKIPFYKDVVDYAHSLKKRCYIAMFSSLVKLDERRINDQVNLSMFDYNFLTYEIGYNKPNPNAFKFIEDKTKINPKNILFIDDTNVNIEEAKLRGWKTCKAKGNELNKIIECVDKFLLNNS